jgi:hypothetical protein
MLVLTNRRTPAQINDGFGNARDYERLAERSV